MEEKSRWWILFGLLFGGLAGAIPGAVTGGAVGLTTSLVFAENRGKSNNKKGRLA
jgi:gas vesicle protein